MTTLDQLRQAERRLEHRLEVLEYDLDDGNRRQVAEATRALVRAGNDLGTIRRRIAELTTGPIGLGCAP